MTRYGDSTLTVVVVHGAWADGSSWNKITQPLQSQGLRVIAAPIPLTSLSDDVRALDRVLERTSGPVVVGAHAYAGAVISATTNVRVQGLVFIAALTPDEGETVADVYYRGTPHAQAPKLEPDTHGLIWMPEPSFTSAFAQDAVPEQAALLAATQRPISVVCIQEKSPPPLWKRKPAWYLVATQDRMINPDTQRFMATRMAARTRIEDVDHTPIVTEPKIVIEVFAAAIAGTAKSSSM